jgi:hypothetical protein
MIMFIMAAAIGLLLFVLIYLGIYTPLFSHFDPGEISDVILAVKSVRLREIDRLLSEEMSMLMAHKVAGVRGPIVQLRRRRAISVRLESVEANVGLFLAFSRRRALKIRRWDPETYSDQEWLLQDVFEKARGCILVLTFAKAVRTFLPWDMERLLNFHRETVMGEVRELMVLFLRLSETYGEWHRENLLTMLEAWELEEAM